MKEIKIVIGANFGDEGKGLMTDYYSKVACLNKKRTVVVLSNGGAQRGHTVELNNGLRHVFHHFGSGTFRGADTFFPREFIINPLLFMEEYKELSSMGFAPMVFMAKECRLSTPFDMMINQIIEEHRGNNRHGSCGLGIWETIVRNGINVGEAYKMGREKFEEYLIGIRDEYLPERLKELGLNAIPDKWKKAVYSSWIIGKYLDDFYEMLNITGGDVTETFLINYDTVIFENGQGLLLSEDMMKEYGDNVTASNTGLKNPVRVINEVFGADADNISIEVCYVTRSYMTRHGAGRFDSECSREEINEKIEDKTNVFNIHQGTIRYGKLNIPEFMQRTQADFEKYKIKNAVIKRAITHLNEYKTDSKDIILFDYFSFNKTN